MFDHRYGLFQPNFHSFLPPHILVWKLQDLDLAENYKETKEIQLYRVPLIQSFSFALQDESMKQFCNIDFNLKLDAAKRNCRNVQCTPLIRYFDFLPPVVDKTFFNLSDCNFFIFQPITMKLCNPCKIADLCCDWLIDEVFAVKK